MTRPLADPYHPLADWMALRTNPPAPCLMSVRDCTDEVIRLAAPDLTTQIEHLPPGMHDDIGALVEVVLTKIANDLVAACEPESSHPPGLIAAVTFSAEVLRGLTGQPYHAELIGDVCISLTGATAQMSEWASRGHPALAEAPAISAGLIERMHILVRALRGVMPPRQAACDVQVRTPQHTAWLLITGGSNLFPSDDHMKMTAPTWRRARQHMTEIATAAGAIEDPDVTLMAWRVMQCLVGDPRARGEPVTFAVLVSTARFLVEQLDAVAAGERLRKGDDARLCSEYFDRLVRSAAMLLSPDDPVVVAVRGNS